MTLAKNILIRPINETDRHWLSDFVRQNWGTDLVVVHDVEYVPSKLAGFIAHQDLKPVGLITYQITGQECDIVTLDSLLERQGIGSALLAEVEAMARRVAIMRLWLITTNDNVGALGFYQRRGFRLIRVDLGAVERARKRKPAIPQVATNGITIRDEFELEKWL